MRLKFVIDKAFDIKTTQILKGMHFNRLANTRVDTAYFNNEYKKSGRFLKLTQKIYQQAWDEINSEFSKYVEETTGYKWNYSTYYCVLSLVCPGCSNWGTGNKILRTAKENPYWMLRITAHELILCHYFEIYKGHYSARKLTDWQVWALAEIAAWAMTSLTREAKKFWPWYSDYYTNHNYPHLVKMQLKMKPLFLNRKSFDDYIEEGIKIIRRYPKIYFNGLH